MVQCSIVTARLVATTGLYRWFLPALFGNICHQLPIVKVISFNLLDLLTHVTNRIFDTVLMNCDFDSGNQDFFQISPSCRSRLIKLDSLNKCHYKASSYFSTFFKY